MKQTFKPSPARCLIMMLFGLLFASLGILTILKPNSTWLDILGCGFLVLAGLICVLGCTCLMLVNPPIYLLDERGLTVKQVIWQRGHFHLNWKDINNIFMMENKSKHLCLLIKDSSRQYFDETMQQTQSKRSELDRTLEILTLSSVVKGGKKALYRTLLDYWQQYR